jgi:N-acetylmuramoyl-L-alanine amidase-like protein
MGGEWPEVPYITAASYGGVRDFTPLVVIHATDNTADAYHEALYCANRTDGTSAHCYSDELSVYQCVPLPDIAHTSLYHGNRSSVQFELCGLSNQLTYATMRKIAPYVRYVCSKYGVPIRKIGPDAVRSAYFNGTPGGICGHADITAAFSEDNGDHTDPGTSFPWADFISFVQGGAMTFINDYDNLLCMLADFTSTNGSPSSGILFDHLRGRTQADVLNVLAGIAAKVNAIAAVVPSLSDDEANLRARIDTVHAEELAKIEAARQDELAAIEAARNTEIDSEAAAKKEILDAVYSLTGVTVPTDTSGLVSDADLADALQAAVDRLRGTPTPTP